MRCGQLMTVGEWAVCGSHWGEPETQRSQRRRKRKPGGEGGRQSTCGLRRFGGLMMSLSHGVPAFRSHRRVQLWWSQLFICFPYETSKHLASRFHRTDPSGWAWITSVLMQQWREECDELWLKSGSSASGWKWVTLGVQSLSAHLTVNLGFMWKI